MANIISLFSGCGGLDLGFEQVGDYTTVWANDFKHEACETFRNHFGDIIVEGDIEQIDPYNMSRFQYHMEATRLKWRER